MVARVSLCPCTISGKLLALFLQPRDRLLAAELTATEAVVPEPEFVLELGNAAASLV
jgi:hypothetical protein